jgi:Kelch motif
MQLEAQHVVNSNPNGILTFTLVRMLFPTIKLGTTIWPNLLTYPLSIQESNGARIGKDFVIISGFYNGIKNCTNKNHALDLTDPNASWRQMDDHPIALGISHITVVVVGMKMYTCGGYIGGDPGPHTDKCFVYDHSILPGTTGQWSTLPSLPDMGRAGAGMVYDTASDSLIFAGGATRTPNTNDHPDTWKYSFANPGAGWVKQTDLPLLANHLSSVTAKDGSGKEHHYWMGGQSGGNECCGNHAEVYEYVPDAQGGQWIPRKFMPLTRGHAASSTKAIGCGFIIAGGTTNVLGKITDVSYYDIPSDTWTKIGDLPKAKNTPVCAINAGMIYCESEGKNQITV